MNSQQELLEAINAITENKEKSFDTPATVLRVDGDTAWVHIDGGADETPVRKTINCEQGETVQVRIANGSAFLVGNASAPPTDDKTANAAQFVAVQAEAKAVEAINTANAIVQTVSEKVSIGDSNIADLSSTMYQNANGVNIFNDTLAVGDSYAHIDGDSFDIKEATTAGTIDDANDTIIASFGAQSYIQSFAGSGDYTKLLMTDSNIRLIDHDRFTGDYGWTIDRDKIETYSGTLSQVSAGINLSSGNIGIGFSGLDTTSLSQINVGGNSRFYFSDDSIGSKSTEIENCKITCLFEPAATVPGAVDPRTVVDAGEIRLTGDVYDYTDGYKKTPTVLTSTTISAATTSYTFTDAAITVDSVIDIYDTIFGFSPTGITVTTGSATITFPAQASTHTIKLFVY